MVVNSQQYKQKNIINNYKHVKLLCSVQHICVLAYSFPLIKKFLRIMLKFFLQNKFKIFNRNIEMFFFEK